MTGVCNARLLARQKACNAPFFIYTTVLRGFERLVVACYSKRNVGRDGGFKKGEDKQTRREMKRRVNGGEFDASLW
jgi:hypothetical protein